MKKSVLSLAIGAALLIAPMTASALTPMTADSLKDATGQAGVSIAVDDITLYQYVGSTTYTDTDGLSGDAADAAGIVISGKETFTTLRAIIDGTNRNGFLGRSGVANANGYGDMLEGTGAFAGTRTGASHIEIAPISIDVAARVDFLSAGTMYNHFGIHNFSDAADITAWQTAFVADQYTAEQAAAQAIVDDVSSTDEEVAAALAQVAFYTGLNAGGATAYATALASTNVAGVVIGLPTIEICKTGDTQTISIAATGSANDGKAFIQISKEDSVLAVLGGVLEIAAH